MKLRSALMALAPLCLIVIGYFSPLTGMIILIAILIAALAVAIELLWRQTEK